MEHLRANSRNHRAERGGERRIIASMSRLLAMRRLSFSKRGLAALKRHDTRGEDFRAPAGCLATRKCALTREGA